MPTLVKYNVDDEYRTCGSTRLFSVLDVYTRPYKRPRINGSYIRFFEKETKPSVEILPDECLYEIFRRLTDAQSRSTSARVSKRWLVLLSNLKISEIVPEKVKVEDGYGQENDGCLTRLLDGKKATDTRLQAIAVGTAARGGLGRLSVTGSDKVTSVGFSAIARGCPNLRVLSLWNVPSIRDEALIVISKECRSLESLDISHCSSISNTGLASIAGNCLNLCSLTIESCKSIGNESLRAVARSCPNLQSLSIKDCPNIGDQGIATVFSTSSALRKVKLQSLDITDFTLAVIGRYGRSISNLTLTGLRNVTPKGFCAMGNEKGLESLTSFSVISCYGVTDMSLEAIGYGCRVLKQISIKKCCFLSDKGLVSFSKAAGFLESLQLEECNRITQHGISQTLSNRNSKLKSFSIVKCIGIKDFPESLEEAVDFSESQTLRSLTIKNCSGFGNASLATIGKLCPHVNHLDLTGLCGLTDTGLDPFLKTSMAGLVKVNLSGCVNLTDKPVIDLAKIHGGSLETLNLDGCMKISDESLSAIGENCVSLNDLDVSKCYVTDFGVSRLLRAGKMNLRVLSLSGCVNISNKSVFCIEELGKSLVGLNLRGCRLIGSGSVESLVASLWRCDILS